MKVTELKRKITITDDQKLADKFNYFIKLIDELNLRNLPEDVVVEINKEIDKINNHIGTNRELSGLLATSKSRLLRLIEKKLKLVPKGYYRNLWMVLGMAAFGIPLGVMYGFALDSMAFIGIGLPIGMVVGMAVGSTMDKKAATKGHQLNF